MLAVHDLHVSYGVIRALRGLTLSVDEGEIVALVGANGAGKTTLLKTLAGLLSPVSGKVQFVGKSLLSTPAHQRAALGISLVPEGRGIFPHLTVRENLLLGAYPIRHRRAEVEHRLKGIYERFPWMFQRQNQPGGTLSGGEQQMVAVGRALMGRPRLLLLDEPSMGLAPFIVRQVMNLVSDIRREGMTILLVEQNARAALKVADRAYILETGTVVHTGSGAELMARTEIRQAYLG